MKRMTVYIRLMFCITLCISQNAQAYEWLEIPNSVGFKTTVYKNTGEESGLSGTYSVTDDGYSGTGISLGGQSYLTQTFVNLGETDEFFRHGRMLIAFDIKAEKTDNALVFAIEDENTSYAAFVLNAGGKMYFNSDKEWPTAEYTPECAKSYSAGVWYNIKILADTQNHRLIYFLNNKYWGEYQIENNKLLNTKIYPNLKIKHLFFNCCPDWKSGEKSDGKFVIDNLAYGIPRFDNGEIIVETNRVGNIMTNGDSDIKYSFVNDSNMPQSYVFKYDIRSDDNRTSQSGEQKISIAPNSERDITVTANADRNGFYTAYARLETSGGSLISEKETRFSVVAKSTVQNAKVGFSAHPMTHGIGSYEETAAVTDYLGGGLYREDYPWSFMYSSDGKTKSGDWAWIAKYPQYVKNSNGEMLAVLIPGPDNMAGVDWPITEQTISNTNVLGLWANYCEQLAKLLKDGCNNFEVYNEWVGQAYNKTKATAAAYAAVLKESAAALRKGNPNAKITAFCCFYTDSKWLDSALAALGDNPGQYFDAVSIHPYMAYWSNLLYPEEAFKSGMDEIKSVLKKYSLEDKPIYATEYGFSSGYSIKNGNEKIYPINERLKAAYNARMLIMGEGCFEKTYLYTICNKKADYSADDIGNRDVDYETNIGFTARAAESEIPYEAYPSAVALAAYNSIFADSEYLENRTKASDDGTGDNDIYMYKFKLADNRSAIALWRATGDDMISLDVGAESVKIYDMYGNAKSLNSYGGYITLKISAEPVYITAGSLSDLSGVEFRESELFNSDKSVETKINDTFYLNISAPTDSRLSFSADCGENTVFDESTLVSDGAKVKISTSDNRRYNASYNFAGTKNAETVDVIISDGEKIYYDETVYVTYSRGQVIDNDEPPTKQAFDNNDWRKVFENSTARIPETVEKEKNNGKLFFRVLH